MVRLGQRAAVAPRHLGHALGGHLPHNGARIGLLGGSFNPAHEAHLEISLEALRRLGLDEVWWLVSPQNPLKSRRGMAPLADRLASARILAQNPRIRVTAIEEVLGSRYTAHTLELLRQAFPGCRFVWLMGADNLCQISEWHTWYRIFTLVTVAIFDRPTYSLRALAAKAARRFARYRVRENAARGLAKMQPPAWVYFHTRLNPLSATEIRARRGQVTRVGTAFGKK